MLLVERSSKKATFLRQVVLELNLSHVEVRAEDARALGPCANVVISRAVADLERLWPIARGALLPGGRLVVMDYMETSPAAQDPRRTAGVDPDVGELEVEDAEIELQTWIRLPGKEPRHHVTVVRKVAS